MSERNGGVVASGRCVSCRDPEIPARLRRTERPTSNGLLVCRGRGDLPAIAGEGEKVERLVIRVTFPAHKQHRALAAGTRRRLSEFPLLLLLGLPRHPAD